MVLVQNYTQTFIFTQILSHYHKAKALQNNCTPFYIKSKSKRTEQIALQEVCQRKSWTKAADCLFMTSGVTPITQVPSTTSSMSQRGLFYVFPALHETTSWKQSSNTDWIERLGESPLSLVLCWKRRICRHKVFSVLYMQYALSCHYSSAGTSGYV